MGIRTRLIAAAMAATALTGMIGASAALAAPPSPTATAPNTEIKNGEHKEVEHKKDAALAKAAASLHVSEQQLVTALDHLKQALAGGDKQAALAAFAKELGVPLADAEKALRALSGGDQKPKPGKNNGVLPALVVQLLAAELHISAGQAERVLTDLEKVKGNGGDIIKDPAFIAIAEGLHITPQQLLDALIAAKKKIAEQQPKKPEPNGSPAK